jgi:ribosome-associated heat shock protein Hsp15
MQARNPILSTEEKRIRLDKWLWAARFYKTRAMAATAVSGGKIDLNGDHTKPAKAVKAGDRMALRIGAYEWDITVVSLSDRRGPASEAQKLYIETEQSQEARQEKAAQLKAERQSVPGFAKGRPTKKERRHIIKFIRDND